jgi:hypothetical protein
VTDNDRQETKEGSMKGTPAQLAAYVGKSERTIHRWLASGKYPHTRLPGGLIEIDDSVLIGPESEQESAIMARLASIERKLDAVSATVSQLAAQRDTLPLPRAQPIQESRPARRVPMDASGELEPGIYAWRDYARSKGYSETTVKRAIDRGDIPTITGRWRRGHSVITQAINDEGKAAMDRLYGE